MGEAGATDKVADRAGRFSSLLLAMPWHWLPGLPKIGTVT
jgi:hypothetical protein